MVEFSATVTKRLFEDVTETQIAFVGKTRWVQLIPSVDEAAMVVLRATATKTPVDGLQVTVIQDVFVGMALWVHVIPFVDEATRAEP